MHAILITLFLQLQMQQLQERIADLQENLSYHRVATERIQSLERVVLEAERERSCTEAVLSRVNEQLELQVSLYFI